MEASKEQALLARASTRRYIKLCSSHRIEFTLANSRTTATISSWLSRNPSPKAIRTVPERAVTMATAKGLTREENQDRVLAASFIGASATESFEVFAVCDGVGGLRAGGECASIALASFIIDLTRTRKNLDRVARLQRAVLAANRAVYDSFKEQGGTTITAILFDEFGATACSVGDSRVYAVESNNSLTQLTTDDTIGARVAQLQGREDATADRGPFANHLAQFIGQAAEPVPQAIELLPSNARSMEGGPRRAYFISTDGIHRMPKQVLAEIVQTAKTSRDATYRLIVVSEWLGGQDNASILWIDPRSGRLANGYRDAVPGLLLDDSFGELHLASASVDDLSATTRVGESFQNYEANVGMASKYEDPHRYANVARSDSPRAAPKPASIVAAPIAQSAKSEEASKSKDVASPAGPGIGHTKRQFRGEIDAPKSPGKKRKKPVRDRVSKSKQKRDDEAQPELDIQISNEPE